MAAIARRNCSWRDDISKCAEPNTPHIHTHAHVQHCSLFWNSSSVLLGKLEDCWRKRNMPLTSRHGSPVQQELSSRWNTLLELEDGCWRELSFIPKEEQRGSEPVFLFSLPSLRCMGASTLPELCRVQRGDRKGPGVNESPCLFLDKLNWINLWGHDRDLPPSNAL